MAKKLLPCPFCGSTTAPVRIARKDADWLCADECQGKGHFVICDYTRGGCGASTGWKRTKKEIVATWNTRTAASEV